MGHVFTKGQTETEKQRLKERVAYVLSPEAVSKPIREDLSKEEVQEIIKEVNLPAKYFTWGKISETECLEEYKEALEKRMSSKGQVFIYSPETFFTDDGRVDYVAGILITKNPDGTVKEEVATFRMGGSPGEYYAQWVNYKLCVIGR